MFKNMCGFQFVTLMLTSISDLCSLEAWQKHCVVLPCTWLQR
uniref:Uncharacterized protein n=1 Tax=Rhizophora mucronata TaxID=61149 RepID=A0A2P2LPD3_RHIMU